MNHFQTYLSRALCEILAIIFLFAISTKLSCEPGEYVAFVRLKMDCQPRLVIPKTLKKQQRLKAQSSKPHQAV